MVPSPKQMVYKENLPVNSDDYISSDADTDT